MDFNDNPAEAAFRAEARASSPPMRSPRAKESRPCSAAIPVPRNCAVPRSGRLRKLTLDLRASLGPRSNGGREAPAIMQVIYQQEEANFAVPTGVFDIGLGMCLPTMLAYAQPDQLRRLVPGTARR